jgi:hypothetical protein
MTSHRFQFRLSTLLWIMLAVACFFGGMAVQRKLDKPISRGAVNLPVGYGEKMVDRDGNEWFHYTEGPVEPQD